MDSRKKLAKILPLSVIVILTIFIFRKYFFSNLIPFPANLHVSYYSPWKYYQWPGYANGPPNKAIGFDIIRLFYPHLKLTIDQIKNGSWPLWNPYGFSGNVHLATYQSAVFYPLNILYFILPMIDAWSIMTILQPIMAGIFMYLFLKELGLSKKASLFGGLGLAFSGWLVAYSQEALVVGHTAIWLPLILYAIEKYIRKNSLRYLILFAFAALCSILAGFLQLNIYVFLTVIAWIIYRLRPLKDNYPKILTLKVTLILTLLICAPQILPAIEAFINSAWGFVDAKYLFDQYLITPGRLITFLAPDFWGNPGAYNYFGGGTYYEKMIYVGIPILIFSLYSLFFLKSPKSLKYFKYLTLAILLLGFSPFGYSLYFSRLPLISSMIPSRILFLLAFGLCALAAFGINDYLKNKFAKKLWLKIFVYLGLAFLTAGVFVVYQKIKFPSNNYALVSFRNLFLPSMIFALAFLVIVFFKKYSYGLLMGLLVLSSVYFTNKYLYFSERRFVFPEVEVLKKVKEISGINRVWGYGNAYIENNISNYYGLYTVGGYSALFPERYGQLIKTQETEGKLINQSPRSDADLKQASEREAVLENPYRTRLLSLLGVKYIMESKAGVGKEWNTTKNRFPKEFFQPAWEDDGFIIWEYKGALPRAFLAYDYLVENNPQKILDYLFDNSIDLKEKIVLEKEPNLPTGSSTGGQIEVISYEPQKVEIQTKSASAALLFLSDNYYPGWEAYVDGKPTEIMRADYTFRAIAVPAGQHRVVFSFKPKSFYWGLKISLISLVLFIIFTLGLWYHNHV
jgi:hypothetical protein